MKPSRVKTRRALSDLIIKRLVTWLSLSLLALNLITGWFVHSQLHHQTDAILLTLAATEAGALNERSLQGLDTHSQLRPHIHPTTVMSPWGGSEQVTKYAFVFNERCELLEASAGLIKEVLPSQNYEALCKEPPRTFFMSALLPHGLVIELRAASARAYTEGKMLTFVVGVEHRPLDTSLWRTVLLSLSASLLVGLIGWWSARRAARRLTSDLAQLERACETLILDHPTTFEQMNDLETLFSNAFNPSDEAPKELATLTKTLSALGGRLTESLSAQRRLIAQAAHELRTPITALRGEIEVTLRRERSIDELKDSLIFLKTDVERLELLSERLLDSASAYDAPLSLQKLSLLELIYEGVLSPIQLENHSLSLMWDPQRVKQYWIEGDYDASIRALSNVVRNTLTHAQASTLSLHVVERDDGLIELAVQDDGIGLDPSLRQALFQPFGRGHSPTGYGLGLSIAHTLMYRQGGALFACPSSFENQGTHRGTTFYFQWRSSNISSIHTTTKI